MAKPKTKPKEDAPMLPPQKSDAEELAEWVALGMANYKAGIQRRLATLVRDDMTASELALIYVYLRHAQDAAEDACAPLDKAIARLDEEVLPQVFERDNITSVNTTIGYRVTASYLFFATIIKEMRDAAHQWLRDNNMGDLIQPTVNAGTLRAEARKLMEDGKELPETLFKTGTKPSMSMTKIKAKE
jgi:hypothetical protein